MYWQSVKKKGIAIAVLAVVLGFICILPFATKTANAVTDEQNSVLGETEESLQVGVSSHQAVVCTYHTYNVSAATCTVAKKCTKCGYIAQKALGHKMQQYVNKQPTCTTGGTYITKCSVCGIGSQYGNGTITMLGHKWNSGTVTKAATCTANGTKTYKCTRSGCSGTTTDTIKALGHSWGAAATCKTNQKCTRSGCTAVKQSALGHSWDAGTVTKAATCTAKGTKTFKCTRSGCTETKAEDIDMIPHNCEWRVTVQPSCKGSGTNQYTCKVCGTGTAWQPIQYYGDHTWVAATCTKAKTCSVCGKTEGSALGHAYAWRTTVNATCTTGGKKEQYCTRSGCTSVVNRQDTSALGHSWDAGTVTKAATCTVKGTKTFKCTRSGCTETTAEDIDMIPHNCEWRVTVQPSCKGSGTNQYTCKVCGKGTAWESIQYYGDHTWEVVGTTNPTCTKEGAVESRCSVCGATKSDPIEKIEHKYEWVIADEPTCENSGLRVKKCKWCGSVKSRQPIQALGHNWKLESFVGASGTSEGSETYRCEVCKLTKTEAHNYQWETTAPHDCVPGKEEYKCTKCNHVRDGRSIQAYGEHKWKLKGNEKDETYCTCICDTCGIEVTREHFYKKTVVLEATEFIEGEMLCKCVFCGDEYYEAIPRLKKTKITYHWNQIGINDTVEYYFSLNDNLLPVVVPEGAVVGEEYVLLGWCVRNKAETILTDANIVQDVVSEIGETAELYAVWERRHTWVFTSDARGHFQKKTLNGEDNWLAPNPATTSNRAYFRFYYAADDDENTTINSDADWIHIERDYAGYWITCDPCFDALSDGESSPLWRRTEVTFTVADNTGKRENTRIVFRQYRPKGYLDSKGNTLTRNQLDNEYADYLSKAGTLTKDQYYNFDGSGIRVSASGNNEFFVYHREEPFCVKEKGKPSYSIDFDNYDEIWVKLDVSYLKLSRNIYETHPQAKKVELNTAVEIKEVKGDASLSCIVYWISDLNKNVTFTGVSSNYLVEHNEQTLSETLLLSGTKLLGLASDIVGLLSDVFPELKEIGDLSALVSGIADNLAEAYVYDLTEEELNDSIIKTCEDTLISMGLGSLDNAATNSISKMLGAKGIYEHVVGIKQAWVDYRNQPENDQVNNDKGFFRYDRTMAVMDIYPHKEITGSISISISGNRQNANTTHKWSERMWVYAFGEIYEVNWKDTVIQH